MISLVNMFKYSTLIDQGVEISIEFNEWPENNQLVIDSKMLDRIVLNLATNALKFTDEGVVKIICSLIPPIHASSSSSSSSSPQIDQNNNNCFTFKIEIIDTGCGMSETTQEHFGELDFFSGEAGGFGLGSFIVDSYIKELQGTLNLKSKLGEGTTVTVELPTQLIIVKPSRKVERPEVASVHDFSSASDDNESSSSNHPGTVLVVEDIKVNRKLLVKTLEKGGFKVEEAENGAVGLKMMLEKNYSTVFMDINMPVMNGDVAVREYWKQCQVNEDQYPKIIIVTGNINDTDRDLALESIGAHDFLTKPVVPKQLWEAASWNKTGDQISPKGGGANNASNFFNRRTHSN